MCVYVASSLLELSWMCRRAKENREWGCVEQSADLWRATEGREAGNWPSFASVCAFCSQACLRLKDPRATLLGPPRTQSPFLREITPLFAHMNKAVTSSERQICRGTSNVPASPTALECNVALDSLLPDRTLHRCFPSLLGSFRKEPCI